MLNREELRSYQILLGFNIWQVERDYLQHLFLLLLSRRSGSELIFKGGTALQKTWGLNRFSIDLDFTQQGELPKNLFPQLEADLSSFGWKTKFKEEKKKESILVKFAVQGPLYRGTERTLTVLRVEISFRERVQLAPEVKEVIPIYPDFQPYLVLVMNSEEILAEKIRAIFTREKARDVFDLRFLLAKGIKLREGIVNKKLEKFGVKFSKSSLQQHLKKVANIWEEELSQLISRVPEYTQVVKEIIKRV